MCKCCWKKVQEKQEDEAALDVTPEDDSPVAFVVPNLDSLQCDVQDVVCERLALDDVMLNMM